MLMLQQDAKEAGLLIDESLVHIVRHLPGCAIVVVHPANDHMNLRKLTWHDRLGICQS